MSFVGMTDGERVGTDLCCLWDCVAEYFDLMEGEWGMMRRDSELP